MISERAARGSRSGAGVVRTSWAPRVLGLSALLAGCDVHEPGISVAMFAGITVGEEEHLPVTLRGPRGDVELEHLHATVERIELVECISPTTRLLERLEALALGTAYAHSQTAPERLDAPHVLDLSRPTTAMAQVGVLSPPPGEYCWARVSFGPADAGALGLAAGSEMVGRSLLLRGRRQAGATWEPLEITSATQLVLEVALTLPDGETSALSLSSERRYAELVYAATLSEWPAEADGDGGDDASARALLAAVGRSLRVIILPPD